MKVEFKRLHEDAILPKYAHPGDAAFDLHSCEDFVLEPKQRHLFKTGISIKLPRGYVSLIWDRSGLAYKQGLTVLGGVIDADYRGDYGVILYNTSDESYEIKKGDRIAQVLIQPVVSVDIVEVEEFSEDRENLREEGGFGSSGR